MLVIVLISASVTILAIPLSFKLKEGVFLVSGIVGLISVLSVLVYFFGIFANDNYKRLSDTGDPELFREVYFPLVMEFLGITVSCELSLVWGESALLSDLQRQTRRQCLPALKRVTL